jgi:hypothetical protein
MISRFCRAEFAAKENRPLGTSLRAAFFQNKFSASDAGNLHNTL